MAAGPRVVEKSVLDVGACDRIGERIEAREQRRSVEHAEQLTDLLALHRVHRDANMGSATVAYAAMLMDSSEDRAARLLWDAQVLDRLGGLATMRAGLLSVEQARVVIDLLAPVDEALAAALWQRVQARLTEDRARGIVKPPARLREQLRGWVIAVDPDGYAARRKDASEADADVVMWHRDDGLVDLVGRALSAPDAQACRDRIDQLAQPTGPADTRTIGQRRQQVLIDLITGRLTPSAPSEPGDGGGEEGAAGGNTGAAVAHAGCCPPGPAAPCGTNVYVHVPLPTAVDATTPGHPPATAEPAEPEDQSKPAAIADQPMPKDLPVPADLVGHGPIDREALADLLFADPVLHRVWIDNNGVPVAVDRQTWRPGRDPDRLRKLLEDLAHGPPPDALHPVHPDDHGTPPDQATHRPPRDQSIPDVLSRPHDGLPGPYRASSALTGLLHARAPRCEWPGCGRRAVRVGLPDCDNDHDLPWPYGPTCSCQMGPTCRGHHQIKQYGWLKHRNPDGSIRWTAPDGRTWTSPNQHPQARPLPHASRPAPRHCRPIAPGVWLVGRPKH